MQEYPLRDYPEATPDDANHEELPQFTPPIALDDVFRRMIAIELQNGRLTRARRRRIVRYAARMGLTAVEAGRLIAECREEALHSDDPGERQHALRLVEPEPPRIPVALTLGVVVALAILLDLLVVRWLW